MQVKCYFHACQKGLIMTGLWWGRHVCWIQTPSRTFGTLSRNMFVKTVINVYQQIMKTILSLCKAIIHKEILKLTVSSRQLQMIRENGNHISK